MYFSPFLELSPPSLHNFCFSILRQKRILVDMPAANVMFLSLLPLFFNVHCKKSNFLRIIISMSIIKTKFQFSEVLHKLNLHVFPWRKKNNFFNKCHENGTRKKKHKFWCLQCFKSCNRNYQLVKNVWNEYWDWKKDEIKKIIMTN